jgi:hypothetical protein
MPSAITATTTAIRRTDTLLLLNTTALYPSFRKDRTKGSPTLSCKTRTA